MKFITTTLLALVSLNIYATEIAINKANITSSKANESKLIISHTGLLKGNPQLVVNDDSLTITIPGAELKNKINKNFNDTELVASINDNNVIINLALPYSLKGLENQVAIALKDDSIELNYPKLNSVKKAILPIAKKSKISRAPGITGPTEIALDLDNKESLKFDEKYLEKIEKDQAPVVAEVKETPKEEVKVAKVDQDNVKITQAAVNKNNSFSNTNQKNQEAGSISMLGYVGKFTFFLALIIGSLYGVLMLFRKGVIKKGSLGFLNSTKMIEVLSTNHIAPKKSIMMIKAHKQVFLVSNTDAGIQLISEIKDVTGILKTGEEELTGSNFDKNLMDAQKTSKEFKLKEVQSSMESEDFAMSSLDDILNDTVPMRKTSAQASLDKSPIEDQVRFSDVVKNKVKNLKQL